MNCPVCGRRIPFNSPACPGCYCDLTEYMQKDNVPAHRLGPRVIVCLIAGSVFILICAAMILTLNLAKTGDETADVSETFSLQEDSLSLSEEPAEAPAPSETAGSEEAHASAAQLSQTAPSAPAASQSAAASLTLTAAPTAMPSPTVAKTEEDNTAFVASSSEKTPDERSPVGVYISDEGNTLVLDDDGLAYYYCKLIDCSEPARPWSYKDGRLEVQFGKMHCLAYADIKDDDFSEIRLEADSLNWDAESFNRMKVDTKTYLKREFESHDPAVKVNRDGTMTFSLDGLSFSVPEQFRDTEDDFDFNNNAVAFAENDVDTDYVCSLLFYRDDGPIEDGFASRFLNNVKLGKSSKTTIAGREAVTRSFEGTLNTGFFSLIGIPQRGILTVITDPSGKSFLYVMMFQTPDRPIDNTEVFKKILSECKEMAD